MSEPAIKEAMKCERYFTQDEKLRRKYEIQEKARRERAKMEQENVLAMIREGLPYDMISRITHLSLKKIQEIAEKNK